jgi:cyclic pyranopterin phosphate synthase
MAKMVDVSGKPDVPRRASAAGSLRLQPSTIEAIRRGRVVKGDALATAEVAALHAMKMVWQVLPHCHPIPITSSSVAFDVHEDRVDVRTTVEATYKTGVEMEALYGATVALLTVWDMVKSMEKDKEGQYPNARIEGIRILEKRKSVADRGSELKGLNVSLGDSDSGVGRRVR